LESRRLFHTFANQVGTRAAGKLNYLIQFKATTKARWHPWAIYRWSAWTGWLYSYVFSICNGKKK